jgi:uncharacterized membrane protein YeaQ/YmgE (transglycosylase-associated protein family)
MSGGGLGVIGNIFLGITGAVIGGFIYGVLGIPAGGLIGSLFTATGGAILLLTTVGVIVHSMSA